MCSGVKNHLKWNKVQIKTAKQTNSIVRQKLNKDHGSHSINAALFYGLIRVFSASIFTIQEQYGTTFGSAW